MSGDPHECREHARECLELSLGTRNPTLKQSLFDLSQTWARIAADLEATKTLLDSWGELKPMGKAPPNRPMIVLGRDQIGQRR